MVTAVALGVQEPIVCSVPARAGSRGDVAIEVAEACGVTLDPWQRVALDDGLAVDAAGKWSAFEVALVLPRQNGKNAIIEILELAGVLEFGEKLIIHSAHLADTSREAFRRLED